jgi:hypothetical protein
MATRIHAARIQPTEAEGSLRQLKAACGRVLTYRVLLISGLYDAVASWLEVLMAAADVVEDVRALGLEGVSWNASKNL